MKGWTLDDVRALRMDEYDVVIEELQRQASDGATPGDDDDLE